MNSFLRLRVGDRDVLINLALIWKVTVAYVRPDPNRPYFYWHAIRELAENDPTAIRYYRVHIGTDEYGIPADPSNPVAQFIYELVRQAMG